MSNKPVYKYNETTSGLSVDSQWWGTKSEEMHRHMFAVYMQIKQNQQTRSTANARNLRLYSNNTLHGLEAGFNSNLSELLKPNRMTFNVIKSCIDTATAKVAKNKAKPYFLTDDGDWSVQQRCIKLNSFMVGLYRTMGTGFGPNASLYSVAREVFKDAAILGTGCAYFFLDRKNRLKAERVLIDEIFVDDFEGIYRTPRQMFRRKYVFRKTLENMFPKFKNEIAAARGAFAGKANQTTADMVELLMGWHLPTEEESGDGRFCVAIENCTLRSDEYKKDYFPFLFQRWDLAPLGFYGQGLADELVGIQLEISKILRTIQIAQHLMAVPQVWLEQQSKTVTKHLDNEIGGIKYYLGRQPIFATPQAIGPELYNHLENLVRKAYEITGISMLSAQAKKPAGLDAAVALREMQDIESERFSMVTLMYEDFFMDAAKLSMSELRHLWKDEEVDTVVQYKEENRGASVKFSEVDIDPDKLLIMPYPTNLLPSTPEGKLSKVQEMMQAGFYDKEEGRELLDFPDVNKVHKLKRAQRSWISKQIESMIESGEYITPEPYQNLDITLSLAQAYYADGKVEGMLEERLELLRRYMKDAESMQMKLQPPAPLPPPTDPGAALAVPEALPTNDLIPQQAA